VLPLRHDTQTHTHTHLESGRNTCKCGLYDNFFLKSVKKISTEKLKYL